MNYYFDTSALCRYYHTEPGSDKVERIVDEPNSQHVLSWLTVLEAQSAFALKVRTGEIHGRDLLQLRKKLKTDIAERRFLVARVLRRHFDLAEQLLLRYGQTRRLRTLDGLHLSVALELRERGIVDVLVTADVLMIDVATSEGLKVENPLSP